MGSRYTTNLKLLDEVHTLMQYLYLSDEHFVVFENTMGIRFRLCMNDDMSLTRRMLNGITDMPMSCDDVTHLTLMGIIDQLKEQPAEEFPDTFENRWEEISTMTNVNIAHNMMHQLTMQNK